MRAPGLLLGLALGLGLVGACDPDGTADGGSPDGGFPWPQTERCTRTYTAFPEPVAPLADPELVEASGIAASARDPELLWIHNDSGDEARVFATGTDGSARGRLLLPAVDAVDFEDIALSRCPGSQDPCLYIADTGDNLAERESVALYIVVEPVVPEGGLGDTLADAVVRVPFTYEGGPVDVEAVAVEPDGSRAWLIEKVDEAEARVYALDLPLETGAVGQARLVTEMSSPGVGNVDKGLMITAADLHPSGRQLALRVYTGVHEFRFDDDRGVESIGEVEPLLVTLGPFTEPQGESVGYDASGLGLWSVSEDVQGEPGQPLHHYDCE